MKRTKEKSGASPMLQNAIGIVFVTPGFCYKSQPLVWVERHGAERESRRHITCHATMTQQLTQTDLNVLLKDKQTITDVKSKQKSYQLENQGFYLLNAWGQLFLSSDNMRWFEKLEMKRVVSDELLTMHQQYLQVLIEHPEMFTFDSDPEIAKRLLEQEIQWQQEHIAYCQQCKMQDEESEEIRRKPQP